ncbi:19230_t:CDS:2 [Entrophospora sp. SA101]|nr:19230_t:CDS:2 [Entrophospora sp. SA101]
MQILKRGCNGQGAKGLFFNAPPTALGEDEIEFAINLYVDTYPLIQPK